MKLQGKLEVVLKQLFTNCGSFYKKLGEKFQQIKPINGLNKISRN